MWSLPEALRGYVILHEKSWLYCEPDRMQTAGVVVGMGFGAPLQVAEAFRGYVTFVGIREQSAQLNALYRR